jgi:hypothetical protein
VYRDVQEELGGIRAHPIRRLLVAVAGDLAGSPEQVAAVCEQAVAEMAASADPTVECLALANMLAGVGRRAVEAVAARFAGSPEAAQVAFVCLLDVIGTRAETPRSLRARIGQLLLEALRGGGRAARLAVVQSTATASPDVPPRTRAALAAELLACLQEFANPGTVDAVEATVVRLGAPAVGPLLDALEHAERPRQRASAARALGLLVPQLEPRHARVAHEAIERALALWREGFPDRPALARAVGRLCAGPAAAAADVARVAETLRAAILDKPVAHAALDGLAHLCLGPKAPPALKVDLTDFFARLMERSLPDIEATRQAGRDEIVYALGGEVLAYTEMVPSIIRGLRHIAATSRGVLRATALDHLLSAWRRIAQGDLQLGPGNTEQLLEALHALGTLPDIAPAQREAIADAVALRRDFLRIYRVLADLVVAAGDAMADRAAALAEELLRRETTGRELTASGHALLLGALVRLATGASLGPRADRLRERVAGVVVDAAKRGVEAAAALQAQLRESPAIPDRLKKRLGRGT